jgi:hypothetical protein
MLNLTSTSDKIQVITGSSGNIDVHADYADALAGTPVTITVGRLNTKITTATTTDVVASPASSTSRNVKALYISNIHASTSNLITVQHTDGTNVIRLRSITLLAGEAIQFVEGQGWATFDAAGLLKVNSSLVAGSLPVTKLSADVSNSTTTAAKITGLDTVCGVGTWLFEYFILYQSAATTTGVKFSCNHTGTVTSFVYDLYGVDVATTSSAAMSQASNLATGSAFAAFSARAKSTAAGVGPTVSVDSANSDMLMLVSGLAIVTVTGNMELYHASEVAAATTVKAGSALRLTRVG